MIKHKERTCMAARDKALDKDELPEMVRTTRSRGMYGTWEPMELEGKWNTYV